MLAHPVEQDKSPICSTCLNIQPKTCVLNVCRAITYCKCFPVSMERGLQTIGEHGSLINMKKKSKTVNLNSNSRRCIVSSNVAVLKLA